MSFGGGRQLGHARGSIEIETSQLEGVAQTARKVGTDTQRALQQISTGAREAESSFSGLGGAARAAGALIATYLTRRTVEAGVELARTAARADQMGQRFHFLANIAGQSSEQMLNAMRTASRAHISDVDLMFAANRAMLLGVADNIEQIETLMRIAGARAGAMGLSFTEAFDLMVSGIGRTSPRLLENLGILVNLNQVYAGYAEQLGKSADGLTELEQRQAVYNTVVEQSRDLVEQHASAGVSAAGKFQVMKASLDNLKVATGALIQDDVVTWAERAASAFDFLAARAEALRQSPAFGARWGDVFAALTGGVTELTVPMRQADVAGWMRDLQELRRLRNEAFSSGDMALVSAYTGQIERLTDQIRAMNAEIGRVTGVGAAVTAAPLPSTAISGSGARFTPEIVNAQREWADAVVEIERSAGAARLSATEQYERQRADTIASYGLSIAREEEDFGRQRARRVAQHEEQIARIRQDAAEREATWVRDMAERIADLREQSTRRVADWTEDHEERIAKLREDGAKRREQIEIDYARNRERAERAHRDTLLNAASRLDARAVAQEQRSFARESEEQAQAHAERLDKEAENLEERIAQEQEAHQKRLQREARNLQERIDQENRNHERRLEDARKADDKRIADQQAAFDKQLSQEDEDRRIRLARQAQDHARQLAQMEQAQRLRLAQIDRQAGEQRAALDAAHKRQLAELGLHNDAYAREERTRLEESQRIWKKYFDDWITMQERFLVTRPRPQAEFPSLLDPWSMPNQGGNIGPRPAPTTTSTNRTTTISLAPGAIVINEAHRAGQTGQEVEDAMIRLLERLN